MKLILLSLVFLAGCHTTVPVKREFPKVPDDMKVACPELKLLESGEKKLSEVISSVAENYSRYHECRLKVDLWIEWYDKQKKTFESVK